MWKSILAVFCGFIATIIVVGIFDLLNYQIFPPPAGLDPAIAEDLKEIIRSAPAGAWALLLLGHAIASAIGGFVAGLIKQGQPYIAVMCGALMIIVATINNILVGETPIWYWVFDLAIYIPLCLIGYSLSRRTRKSSEDE